MQSSISLDYDIQKALRKEGLSNEDFKEICRRLDRKPNRTELGMFGVMWSEHCCYRNSKQLLTSFPTTGPRILVGPGENAGVVDLGDGLNLAFKIESHNHPSAIEPFQGAATGVGGILRDIFTMGARPIAILNSLRFGPLEDEKNIGLLEGVVSGISHYGNCVGVPTVGGEVSFDSSYSGNPLVNAMALGLLETKDIVCSGAKGIGYPVIYVGSTTGRDGMGGASFASSELTNSSLDDRPAVQVGDPFLEKGLIEACLDVFKIGNVVAAQDMGAAGLTCSTSEMASKGGVGIELNLDLVPAREKGMTPYEFLLSESQERMLFVVKPGKEESVMDSFRKWGLQASVVGKVLRENIVRVIQNNEIVADLPASALADDTPIDKHKLISDPPQDIEDHWKWNENLLPNIQKSGIQCLSGQYKDQFLNWNQILIKLLDDPTIASKRWIYSQYDHQIQSNTVILPGKADAAVIRLRSQNNYSYSKSNKGIAAVVDCQNRWVSLDPLRGSIASVAEASRNLVCVGAQPLAVTDNLNFPSPETDKGYWQLASACQGISEACNVLSTPVTGGNVSLYNETRDSEGKIQPIHPTPVIGMVGLIDNLEQICSLSWKNERDSIYLIAPKFQSDDQYLTLSASSYLEVIHGLQTGRPPLIDLNIEKKLQSFLLNLIKNKLLSSAHDISDGGLAVALSESSIDSGLGVDINLFVENQRIDKVLFAEGGSRIIVSVSSEKFIEWDNFISESLIEPITITHLGSVIKEPQIRISNNNQVLLDESLSLIKDSYESSIPRRVKSL